MYCIERTCVSNR